MTIVLVKKEEFELNIQILSELYLGGTDVEFYLLVDSPGCLTDHNELVFEPTLYHHLRSTPYDAKERGLFGLILRVKNPAVRLSIEQILNGNPFYVQVLLAFPVEIDLSFVRDSLDVDG